MELRPFVGAVPEFTFTFTYRLYNHSNKLCILFFQVGRFFCPCGILSCQAMTRSSAELDKKTGRNDQISAMLIHSTLVDSQHTQVPLMGSPTAAPEGALPGQPVPRSFPVAQTCAVETRSIFAAHKSVQGTCCRSWVPGSSNRSEPAE